MSTRSFRYFLSSALLAVLALGAGGCTIAATPSTAQFSVAAEPAPAPAVQHVHTTHVVHHTPPARVYHNNVWLHYRTDGYYYRSNGVWHVANAVPSHVVVHHRPGRPTHVVRTNRSSRPVHVQRTTTRRASPTHVRRTTSHRSTTTRRTYRR